MRVRAHSHCHFCGAAYSDQAWPRTCSACGQLTYRNPLPGAVLIAPVEGGRVVLVRRASPPLGLAFPGGYIEYGEDWRAAALRELREETGIRVPSSTRVLEHGARSSEKFGLLVFGRLDTPLTQADLEAAELASTPREIEEVVLARVSELSEWSEQIVFPRHREVARELFAPPAAARSAEPLGPQ